MRRALAGLTVLASLGLGLALAGPALAGVDSVHVGSFYFEDGTVGDGKVVVNQGDQITFVFDNRNTPHTATVTGQFDSGKKTSPQTWTTSALLKAGTFKLFCGVHPEHYTTLVVRTTGAPAPSPTPPNGGTTGGSTTGGSTTGGTTTGGTTTGGATATPRTVATSGGTRITPPAAPKPSPTPTLARVGTGVADPKQLAQAPAASNGLARAIGRSPFTRPASWTRAVRQALLGLLPMAFAGW